MKINPGKFTSRIQDVMLCIRLLGKVDICPRGCWVFRGWKDSAGYGKMWYDGKMHWTHRLAYAAYIGEIPEKHVIDHKCCNKSCCNPWHLEPVTHAENIRRSHARSKNS